MDFNRLNPVDQKGSLHRAYPLCFDIGSEHGLNHCVRCKGQPRNGQPQNGNSVFRCVTMRSDAAFGAALVRAICA
jgi:hypothetical protein